MSKTSDKLNVLQKIALIQHSLPVIPKTKQAYGYMYAPLDMIFEVLNPLLKKHELSIFHSTQVANDRLFLSVGVMNCIDTSDTFEILVPLDYVPGKVPMQSAGAAITYARRYGICMIFNILSDEDTDGSHEANARKCIDDAKPRITDEQGNEFRKLLTREQYLAYMSRLNSLRGWKSPSDIPLDKFSGVIADLERWLEKNKGAV